jgi:hypothetical protein
MNQKLNKTLLLASVSIGLPYLSGYAHAEKKPQTDCELRRIGEVAQIGLENGANPKGDISSVNKESLRGNQVTTDKPTNLRADGWSGRFKFFPGQDEHGHYEQVIDVACDTDSNCTAEESLQIEGKVVPEPPMFDGSNPTPSPRRLPLDSNKMTTTIFRRSVLDLASVIDFPHAAPYFEPEIYRRIGTPNHVVECRENRLLMICKLDEPLVRDDYGSLTSWIILFPDLSSGPGCPGYGCPHALKREEQ